MKSAGLCIGASSVSLVLLEKGSTGLNVIKTASVLHEGNPHSVVLKMLTKEFLESVDYLAVTGRKFKNMLALSSVSEAEAVEYGCLFLKDASQALSSTVVSAGGETFMVYQLDDKGNVIDVYTGNKCASGTGEFFLQQLKRLDLTLDEAMRQADVENPFKVSGRCSVFCKSDCTHALNKGAPKESIVGGLCEMMAAKILELLKKTENKQVLLVGGISKNEVIVDFLRKQIPNLQIPEHAETFEALGAALWAWEHKKKPAADFAAQLLRKQPATFSYLSPLKEHLPRVTFKEAQREEAQVGDICILGLDVGSTTTKAVLIREKDQAVLAGCYLRTSGDPVAASRECYRLLSEQVEGKDIKVIGLGVTGSGRQIAGLHALTPAVINEIIAHATAAAYFDPAVDTIFEIGGQDAKYTYLTGGVPSDYAMNEACSAGTGSFLEESAKESLDVDVEAIGEIALNSSKAPNFNDQCAAFINTDIKTAIQEGIGEAEILAGLVYSICLNYTNRVKGNRAIGEKIFMQGGVCYNRAVPVAMAALTGKKIIVPPDPGLMGAFGVALEVKKRLELELLKPRSFNLKELAAREVVYKKSFQCAGGKEKCDRKCSISRIVIENRTYPFGGACNKYINTLYEDKEVTDKALNLVQLREKLLFEKYGRERTKRLLPLNGKTIGINNSLMTNTLYPLYHNFFTALGYEVILSETPVQEGLDKKGAAFCYPVELAHGLLADLQQKNPDIYFLPHIKAIPAGQKTKVAVTCPFIQGEPYYLQATFEKLREKQVLAPMLDMTAGYEKAKDDFLAIGKELGLAEKITSKAFVLAVEAQNAFHNECREIGTKVLKDLESRPEEIAMVLFGRSYNAFTKQAHMGIPHKFFSRGYSIIPYDFLPLEQKEVIPSMYWASGQMILRGADMVAKHPQLFGTFVTNFSCGPDSFIVSYFRETMRGKPSLTLELDSHTADAGIDTRIEAFMDIIKNYIEINKNIASKAQLPFTPAKTFTIDKKMWVEDSSGNKYPLDDPRVHVLVPSMGEMSSQLLAASLRYAGLKATALPAPTAKEFKLGQGFSSCKECLPLILTLGSLINYLETRETSDEVLVYFMPDASGPCRFGQYNILMKNFVNKQRIKDVAFLSLSSENAYAGLGNRVLLRAWQSILISDVLEEIHNAILTIAKDKKQGIKAYTEISQQIIYAAEHHSWKGLKKTLALASRKLASLKTIRSLEEAPKIALIGEIYVRRDDFSRQELAHKLAARGIIAQTAPMAEWIYYCDYNVKKGHNDHVITSSFKKRFQTRLQGVFKTHFEKEIKTTLAQSGLYDFHMLDVEKIISCAENLVSPKLTGETVLTVGSAINEIVDRVSGVISIGPFGCMPNRIAESIISQSINETKPQVASDRKYVEQVMRNHSSLPFLSIETDGGNLFTPVVEARLDAFCLKAERLYKQMQNFRHQAKKYS